MFGAHNYVCSGTVSSRWSVEIYSLDDDETGRWLEEDERNEVRNETFPDVIVVRYNIEDNPDVASVDYMETHFETVMEKVENDRANGVYERDDEDNADRVPTIRLRKKRRSYYAFIYDWIVVLGKLQFSRTWGGSNRHLSFVIPDLDIDFDDRPKYKLRADHMVTDVFSVQRVSRIDYANAHS